MHVLFMPDHRPQIRQKRVLDELDALGLDALLLNPGPSLTYLTGLHFHLSERPVVAIFRPDGVPSIVLPELEEGKVHGLEYDIRSFTYGEDPSSWERAFRQAVLDARLDFRRVGIEPRRLRVLELRLVEEAAPRAAYLNGERAMAELRMRKDGSEIDAVREAVLCAQEALAHTLDTVRIGRTERDLAGELTAQLLRAGSAPELPFSPIVAFGSRTANPHAVPTDIALSEGDLVLFDWGANVDGYFSDLTRMFSVGNPDDELGAITRLVAEANEAARETAGPGVPVRDVDAAARGVIEAAGYGPYFIHRTGHGLGMEGHEEPYIRADSDDVLAPGMVFTIEPGVYLPGRGGARVEDDLLVTEDGADCLSTCERGLVDVSRRDGFDRQK